VSELRELHYLKGIELMLRIGELILGRLYGGDVTKWKSRGRKDFSFRRLQQYPDLPFKASMLSRAVSMYVLSRRRADLLKLENVSQTHLQELINLDPALQDDLIARVESEKWTVQRLRAAVIRSLPPVTRRAGRPRSPTFSRQLRNLKNIVEDRLLVIDTANVAVLQFAEANELLDTARRLCQQAELVASVLAAHVATLDAEQDEAPVSATGAKLISGIHSDSVSSTKHTAVLLPPAIPEHQEGGAQFRADRLSEPSSRGARLFVEDKRP